MNLFTVSGAISHTWVERKKAQSAHSGFGCVERPAQTSSVGFLAAPAARQCNLFIYFQDRAMIESRDLLIQFLLLISSCVVNRLSDLWGKSSSRYSSIIGFDLFIFTFRRLWCRVYAMKSLWTARSSWRFVCILMKLLKVSLHWLWGEGIHSTLFKLARVNMRRDKFKVQWGVDDCSRVRTTNGQASVAEKHHRRSFAPNTLREFY
jgi:hypothetical protein